MSLHGGQSEHRNDDRHTIEGRRASKATSASALGSASAVTAAGGGGGATLTPSGTLPMTMDANGDDMKTDTTPPPETAYVDDEDITIVADRDPFRWHEIVKVKFDDIFGEPDPEIFSIYGVWKISGKVYTQTKYWCYRLLSLFLALPLAIVWGMLFSCLAFLRIWICVPCLKASDIQLHCLRRLIETLLRTFLAPCFEAVGRCLYHIRLRILRGDESL